MAINVAPPPPLPATTAELLRRLRHSSVDALGDLYSRFSAGLFRLAYRLSGSKEDAEDAVHDVFVGLPEALQHYEERGRFESWLKQITARVALMKRRSRNRRGEVPLEDVHSGHERTGDPDAIALRSAIDTLPDALRSVLLLKEIEGYSHTEIAETLAISAVASRVRLARALRRLRRILGER